jgi:hypothetical protein
MFKSSRRKRNSWREWDTGESRLPSSKEWVGRRSATLYLILAALLGAALVLWRYGYLARWFGT